MRKFLSTIGYGRVGREFYRLNRAQIDEVNCAMMRYVCPIATILAAFFLILSSLTGRLTELHLLYWLALAAFALFTVLSCTVLKSHPRLAAPLYYLLAVCSYALGIYLSGWMCPGEAGSIFFTFLIVLPILIVDRILLPLLLNTAAGIVFCLISATVKAAAPAVVEEDLINTLFTLLMSIFFTYFVLSTRLQNLQAVRLMKREAEMDQLTGLINKSTTELLCGMYLREPHTAGCALLVMDVDYFKSINDRLGHQRGDAVLHAIGGALRGVFRETDVVGRIGGDEFAVLLRDIPNVTLAEHKAQEVLAAVRQIFAEESASPLSCSIGIAYSPDGRTDYARLFSRADTALYQSKRQGRGCATLYREGTSESEEKPSVLVADDSELSRSILRNALESGYTVFQAENGLEAMELLRRWSKNISAVLLDLEMPVYDGYAVLKDLHDSPALVSIPVVLITAAAKSGIKIPEGSVADIIPKPFDPETVRRAVDQAVQSRRKA